MSEYRNFDLEDVKTFDELSEFYPRHIGAMTQENLHSKSDIAWELCYRENKIKKLEAERDALRLKLIETAQELNCMIDMANAKLEQNISATDDTPPDYFDAQTVHEAMILANKLEGEG